VERWEIANRGSWSGVRHLEGLVEYPIVRKDGSILQQSGYDEKTQLFLCSSSKLPPVPNKPTLDDAKTARDRLFDVVEDFPFDGDAHKSAWLAALLTPLARFAFDGPVPLFLVDSNVRGSGKGLCSTSFR